MRRDLEGWLRGDVPHPAEAEPLRGTVGLNLPIVPLLYPPLAHEKNPHAKESARETFPVSVAEKIPDVPLFETMPEAVPETADAVLFGDLFLSRPENGDIEEESDTLFNTSGDDKAESEIEEIEQPALSADFPVEAADIPETLKEDLPDPDIEPSHGDDAEHEAEYEHEEVPDEHEDGENNDEVDKNEPDEPAGLIDDRYENQNRHESRYREYEPAEESPEQEAVRFTEQLRRIEKMRRASLSHRRNALKGRLGRFFTLCMLVILVAGTIFAFYQNRQRNSFESLMAEADAAYSMENYESAFELYNRTASRYPARTEPLLGMAHAAEQSGRIEDAIGAYEALIKIIPTGVASGAFCEIGRLYAVLKSWDRAQENYERAKELDATNYNAFLGLGNALEAQDKVEKALPAYKHALGLSPSSTVAAEAVKRVTRLLSREDEEAAAAEARKYEQAVQVGNVALGLKHYDEASRYFAEALAIRSDDVAPWIGFAEARQGLGDTSGAIQSLRRVLEKDPDNADAKTRLSALEEARKKKADPPKPSRRRANPPRSSVPARITRRFATAPVVRQVSRRVLFDEGVELYRQGEYRRAFDLFLACLRSSDADALPAVALAGDAGPFRMSFRTQLRVPSDMKLLAEAVRLNPADRALYLNLALTETRMLPADKTLRTTVNDIYSHALARR